LQSKDRKQQGREVPSKLKARTTLLLILGILLLLSGSIFTLQGLGILGPTDGFMYNSQTWVFQGSVAAVIGAVLVVLALVLAMTAREKSGQAPQIKP